MTDFIQKTGFSMKRNTNVSDQQPTNTNQQPMYPPLPSVSDQSQSLKSQISGSPLHDKVQRIADELEEVGIHVLDVGELIIRNYKEYVLIKELRRREKEDLIKSIKGITNKYKNHL